MTTFDEKRELAKEAIELIKEFNEVQENIKESHTSNFKIIENEEEDTILISFDEDINGEEVECELSRIYEIFEADMDGFGPCSAYFYDMLAYAKEEAEGSYGEVSKEEYIQRVGNVSYVEKRCEEIYERLKEISSECE